MDKPNKRKLSSAVEKITFKETWKLGWLHQGNRLKNKLRFLFRVFVWLCGSNLDGRTEAFGNLKETVHGRMMPLLPLSREAEELLSTARQERPNPDSLRLQPFRYSAADHSERPGTIYLDLASLLNVQKAFKSSIMHSSFERNGI